MKKLNYLVILLVLLSCGRKPVQVLIENPDLYCLTSMPVQGDLPLGETCQQYKSYESTWCNVIPADTLMLSEVSKCWIPQYKYEIGKKFIYKNEDNQIRILTLIDKGHVMSQRVLKSEACDTSSYRLGLCYSIESYYVILEDDEIKLYIGMTMDLSRSNNPEFDEILDEEMQILQTLAGSKDSYHGSGLRVDEFDDSLYQLSDFKEEKIIQNKKFKNVYQAGDYYYNKELGLISFDRGGWVLQE